MTDEIVIDELETLITPIDVDELYLQQLFSIYHQRLIANKDACVKLKRRGIDKSLIVQRQIGLCDRKLNRYVQPSDCPDGAGFRGALRRAGLTKINGHELFRGCVVEPVFDAQELVAACGIKLICPSRPAPRIIQWYRRKVYARPVQFRLMVWGARYVAD